MHTQETTRGGTMLMQRKGTPAKPLPLAAATAPTTNAPVVAAPSTPPAGDIELALLNSLAVSDSDFETLASDRAKAVRDYILQTGKVEAERIFITETQPGGVKTNGSKAYLQLK